MTKKEQAKLYYLYMMEDGEIAIEERNLFATICAQLSLDTYEMQCVIDESLYIKNNGWTCVQFLSDLARNVQSNHNISGYMPMMHEIGKIYINPNKEKVSILWNLINLGYCDKDFSYAEIEVVEFFVNHWNIPKDIYYEFLDVAETMASLTYQMEWVTHKLIGDYRFSEMERLNRELDYTYNNVMTTISEVN